MYEVTIKLQTVKFRIWRFALVETATLRKTHATMAEADASIKLARETFLKMDDHSHATISTRWIPDS